MNTNTFAPMPVRQVRTDHLEIGYHLAGGAQGRPVILLHGFPYDIRSYEEIAPALAAQGMRVIVPYLRGHGTTRLTSLAAPRSGERAALGEDVIALMDALHIPEAVLVGHDWGGRAAAAAAALRPTRCIGLICAAADRVSERARQPTPQLPRKEFDHWYQFYLLTERGRAGLARHRRGFARVVWRDQLERYDDDRFARSARSLDNPDFVDIVVHGTRHHFGLAPGYADHAEAERKLAQPPALTRPAIAIDTLPQNTPLAFMDAITQLVRQGAWRT